MVWRSSETAGNTENERAEEKRGRGMRMRDTRQGMRRVTRRGRKQGCEMRRNKDADKGNKNVGPGSLSLGADSYIPSRYVESFLRVFKQFACNIPRG